MKHLNKKLIYIMMAFVVVMACVCVAFIKVNATAADKQKEETQSQQIKEKNELLIQGNLTWETGTPPTIDKIYFKSTVGGNDYESSVSGEELYYEISATEESIEGYWYVDSSTGYTLDTSVKSYFQSTTENQNLYKIFTLNFKVNDTQYGKITNYETGEDVTDMGTPVAETITKIETNDSTYLNLSISKETYSFCAVAKDGATFKDWTITPANKSNSVYQVDSDLTATANFEAAAPTTLHLSGKLQDTSGNPLANTAFTFETTGNRTYNVTTDSNGKYTINDIAQGTSGSFNIADETGYELDKSIENLQASSDDFNITAYKKYTLTLAVDDETHGEFIDDSTGKEASTTQQIVETLSDVYIDGENNKIVASTTQGGITVTQKFTPQANLGWGFKALELKSKDANSIADSTVTGNLIATAYFERTSFGLNGYLKDSSGIIPDGIDYIYFKSTVGGKNYSSPVSELGGFGINVSEEKSIEGYWYVEPSTGYSIEKVTKKYDTDALDISLTAYKVYDLSLLVNGSNQGKIIDDQTKQEASSTEGIIESLSTVEIDKNTNKLKISTKKGEEADIKTFTPQANEGYEFNEWTLASTTTNSTLSDTVTGNMTATAYFKAKKSSVTFSGTVKMFDKESKPIPLSYTFYFNNNDGTSYPITPDEDGYSLTIEGVSSLEGTFSFDSSVTDLIFEKKTYTIVNDSIIDLIAYSKYTLNLSVNDNNQGQIIDDSTGKEASDTQEIIQTLSTVEEDTDTHKLKISTRQGEDYNKNTFTPKAKDGYEFEGWSIAPENTNSTFGDTVTGNLRATASFKAKKDITLQGTLMTKDAEGRPEPCGGATIYFKGSNDQTYTITTNDDADFSYTFEKVGILEGKFINGSKYTDCVFEDKTWTYNDSVSDLELVMYKKFTLNLAVDGQETSTQGKIIDDTTGKEASSTQEIIQTLSTVEEDKDTHQLKVSTKKGEEAETKTFTPQANDGYEFDSWNIGPANTSSTLGDGIQANWRADACFKAKKDITVNGRLSYTTGDTPGSITFSFIKNDQTKDDITTDDDGDFTISFSDVESVQGKFSIDSQDLTFEDKTYTFTESIEDLKLCLYGKFTLNLAVDDTSSIKQGKIIDDATKQEASSTQSIIETLSTVEESTDTHQLKVSTRKGDQTETKTFTPQANEGYEFNEWTIAQANTNSTLSDTVTGNLKATAYFKQKETGLYLAGKVLNNSEPVAGATVTLTSTDTKTKTYRATTDITGTYKILDIPKGTSGSLSINQDSGYFLKETNIELDASADDFNLTVYKIYTLTLAVDDSTHGKFIDDSTGQEASSKQQIIETLSDVQVDGDNNKLVVRTNKESTPTIQTFTPEANTGWEFSWLEIKQNDTNSTLNSTVMCNLIATAYFEKKEEPVTTLHLSGKVLNTSNEPVEGAKVTLTTTEPKVYTSTTDETGKYKLEGIAQGASGSFTIEYGSGYVLEKSIENLQESSDDLSLTAYQIYTLNLDVNDTDLGHIQISGQEADDQADIYETVSDVTIDGANLIVTYKGEKFTYTAIPYDGAKFESWNIESENLKSTLGGAVTGNIKASANFTKVDPTPTPDPDPKPTPTPDPDPTPTPEPTPASDDSPSSYDNGGSTSSSTGDGLPIPFIALGALGALGCAVVVKKKFI